MRRVIRASSSAAAALALVLAPAAWAQTAEGDLRKEIEELKKGQQQIQKDLAEIKRLLAAKPAPAPARPSGPNVANVVFNLGDNPVLGEQTAKVTLVEFTDYQWPYCSRHVRETYPQIKKDYIDTGKIRYVTLDLPLESIHPLAFKASEATHCAGDQGKFWEMHARLFEHQRALEPWSGHAEAIGLDVAKFDDCMERNVHAGAVRRDMAEARKAGASGTPSFVVAFNQAAADKVKGFSFIRGAQPYGQFQSELDRALAAAAKPKPATKVESE